jgi:two-component system, LytTR family, sensor kinase
MTPEATTSSSRDGRYIGLSRREMLIIFAFWTFMALLSAVGFYLDPRGRMVQPGPLPGHIVVPFAQYYLWALLTPLVFRLASAVTTERTRRAASVIILLAAGVLIAMFVDVVFSWLRFDLLGPPPRPPGVRASPLGPFSGIRRFWFLDDLALYMALLGAGIARATSLRLRRRNEDAVRLKAEAARLSAQLAEARVAALRMQLNPHFLFNTLHAVSSLVERDPKGVRRMIARLSELLRHTLEGAETQEHTLEQELALVDRYLDIVRIRFQGSLDVDTRLDPETLDALVPTLILQPLVENAVKHGVGESIDSGRIVLEAARANDELVLRVLDNGAGLKSESAVHGVGLRNTGERLAALYGGAHSLVLRQRPEGGVCAEVRLPYHTRPFVTNGGVGRE